MLATVLGLTKRFNDTGTSIWRVKRTKRDPNEKLSILETLEENENAQGVFSTKVSKRMPDLPVRKQIPDPCPQAVVDHAWAEAIAVARTKWNRMIMYDGRRLHNQFAEEEACARLTLDPRKGRLTMNSFFWHSPETM